VSGSGQTGGVAAEKRRGPVVLIGIGAVLSVLGIAGALIGVVLVGDDVVDTFEDVFDFRDDLAVEVPVPGSDTFELVGGEEYTVFAIGDDLVRSSSGVDGFNDTDVRSFTEPDVAITDPSGDAVRLGEAGALTTYDLSIDAVSIAEFEAPASGTYEIVVDGPAGAVSSVGVGDAFDVDDVVGLFGRAALIVLGGITATIGFVLLVIGAIWMSLGGSKPSPPPAGPWGGQPRWGGAPGPPPSGWGGQHGPSPWGAPPPGGPPGWGPPQGPPPGWGGPPPPWGAPPPGR
jgi:hypothetical protein